MLFLLWLTRACLLLAACGFGVLIGVGCARHNDLQGIVCTVFAAIMLTAFTSSFYIKDDQI